MSKKKKKTSAANARGRQVYKSAGPRPRGDVSWMKDKYIKPDREEQTENVDEAPEALPEQSQAHSAGPEQRAAEEETAGLPEQEKGEETAQQPAVPDEETQRENEPGDAGDPIPEQIVEETPEPAAPQQPEETEEELPGDGEDAPLTEEEQRRIAEMTRTVQVSLTQILDALPDMPDSSAPEPQPPTEEEEEPDPRRSIGQVVGNGLAGFAKWILLVVVLVALIGGGELAWLYHQATPEAIPEITVTFNGETVEPVAYSWHVPVAGNVIKRTYAETFRSTPYEVGQEVEISLPNITVSPNSYASQLAIT
ncbi:MAG: hypothetical protein ACI4OL_07550, partial [Gemmiger sp.]